MIARRTSTGIAGSVFILGVVGLVPLFTWSALLAVVAMFGDACVIVAQSVRRLHRFHGPHIGR
jgi:hypothetical protein